MIIRWGYRQSCIRKRISENLRKRLFHTTYYDYDYG